MSSDYDQSNHYQSHGDSAQRKHQFSNSGQRHQKQFKLKSHGLNSSDDKYDCSENLHEIKSENQRLKKNLKQSNAKISSLVKECSEYQKQIEKFDNQIQRLQQKVDEDNMNKDGDQYRVDELRFLNKQLSEQLNELRDQNQALIEKVRYCSEVIQKKYEDLEQKLMKRIQQAMKRVKKAVHYLETLSIKDIEKTKEILVENLKKASELLKGRYAEDQNAEHEIEQLMNPLKTLQQQLSQKSKELGLAKVEIKKLQEQVKKHKRIENQLLPQYKQSIEGLKRNLAQVRAQLADNQLEKLQIKQKYQQKFKQFQHQHHQLLVEYRKNKLQKKIFENKLEELEEEKEQEKERLVGENQMLKKLYENKYKNPSNQKQVSDSSSSNQVSPKQTQIKGNLPAKLKNFKRKPYQQKNCESEESNLEGYNSADYYHIKTTKNTYGDQPAEDHKPTIINRSHKELNNKNKQKLYQKSRDIQQIGGGRYYRNSSQQRGKIYPPEKISQYEDQNEEQNQIQESSGKYGSVSEDFQFHPEQNSMSSQQSLRNQICRIDQQIMQIQKNLTKELEAYK